MHPTLEHVIYKAYINRSEGENRQKYIDDEGLQYPTFDNGQIIQTENKWENIGIKLHVKSDGPDRHVINTSHLTTEYTFFSGTHGAIFRIDLVRAQVLVNRIKHLF